MIGTSLGNSGNLYYALGQFDEGLSTTTSAAGVGSGRRRKLEWESDSSSRNQIGTRSFLDECRHYSTKSTMRLSQNPIAAIRLSVKSYAPTDFLRQNPWLASASTATRQEIVESILQFWAEANDHLLVSKVYLQSPVAQPNWIGADTSHPQGS